MIDDGGSDDDDDGGDDDDDGGGDDGDDGYDSSHLIHSLLQTSVKPG